MDFYSFKRWTCFWIHIIKEDTFYRLQYLFGVSPPKKIHENPAVHSQLIKIIDIWDAKKMQTKKSLTKSHSSSMRVQNLNEFILCDSPIHKNHQINKKACKRYYGSSLVNEWTDGWMDERNIGAWIMTKSYKQLNK